jgi:transcription antitermination protein NusB
LILFEEYMSKRREGRQAAIQYLHQLDIHGDRATDLRADFWALREAPDKVRNFAEDLIKGVNGHIAELDDCLNRYLQNFKLDRLNVVDRNILRLAVYEMFHCAETPPIVAINEAIEAAKKFGGEDSGKFVNGVLDKVKTELTRPLRDAVPRGAGKN